MLLGHIEGILKLLRDKRYRWECLAATKTEFLVLQKARVICIASLILVQRI
jgi:hypothetical protein